MPSFNVFLRSAVNNKQNSTSAKRVWTESAVYLEEAPLMLFGFGSRLFLASSTRRLLVFAAGQEPRVVKWTAA